MKGTFISADFVEDSSGNLKFLELNTDTAGNSYFKEGVDWASLIELISGSSLTGTEITEFHVVYKPAAQQSIVDSISQSLSENLPQITTFVKHEEDVDTIYPTSVDDADNRFILRLAYDENAILDSLYCRDGVNSLLLFNENNDLDSCVPFYYSGSSDYVNSLLPTLPNEQIFPDYVVKLDNTLQSVKFYKAGPYLNGDTYVSSSEYDSNRISAFTSSLDLLGGGYIMNYLYSPDIITDNAVSSVRTYHIVYGGSLNTINIGSSRVYAPFTLPSENQIEWTEATSSVTELKRHHYHEYSTSNLKENSFTRPGVFETENLISSSGDALSVVSVYENYSGSNIELRTFFISGSPDTDLPSEYLTWYHVGDTLPVGSSVSSSVVTNVFKSDHSEITLAALKVEGSDSIQYVSPISNLLVYESSSNETKFLPIKSIDANDAAGYFSYNTDGSLKKITENNYIVLKTDTTGSFYAIDIESFDYFFVGELGSVAMGIHNACFIAGTRINISHEEYVNIEDVKEGDMVLSMNNTTGDLVASIVGGITTSTVNQVVKISIDNDSEIVCTPEHPFYVERIDGYQMAKNLQQGDKLKTAQGVWCKVVSVETLNETHVVYNLTGVKEQENFFVENVLVHNKPML